MSRFGAVVTAMVTPFGSDGSLDLDAAAGLARWLTDHGSEGLVVGGTTGDLPWLVYDIPVRTGRKVAHDVLVRLAREVPTIVGVKDASGDPAGSARLIADAPAGFELYSGDDSLTLPLLSVGAVGVIGVATHWAAPQFAEMMTAFGKGDVAGAREVNALLLPSYAFETGERAPNP